MNLYTIILFLLCLTPHLASSAQDENIYKLTRADKLKNSNPALAKQILDQVNPENLSQDNKNLLIYLKAFGLTKVGRLDEAVQQLTWILNTTIAPQLKTKVLRTLVISYAATLQWEKGLDAINSLISQINEQGSKTELAAIYTTFAIFYNFLGEHNIAKEYAMQAIALKSDPVWICAGQSQYLFASVKIDISSLTEAEFFNTIEQCELTGQTILFRVFMFILQNII